MKKKQTGATDRAARLREALRANLQRRKQEGHGPERGGEMLRRADRLAPRLPARPAEDAGGGDAEENGA